MLRSLPPWSHSLASGAVGVSRPPVAVTRLKTTSPTTSISNSDHIGAICHSQPQPSIIGPDDPSIVRPLPPGFFNQVHPDPLSTSAIVTRREGPPALE